MKKFVSLLLIFIFISVDFAQAAIPYADAGRFDDEILRPEFRKKFSVLGALAVDDTLLTNARLYLAVEDKAPQTDAGGPLTFPNSLKKLRVCDYRRGDAADYPVDYVSFILQRLFPSPDGMNIVPNQGSHNDPVKGFTPEVIGAILNRIRDFDPQQPTRDPNFVRDLAFDIDFILNRQATQNIKKLLKASKKRELEDAYKKRQRQGKHKVIDDFATSLVQGLVDQAQSDLYPPHFLEKVLFAFALRKAASQTDVNHAMRQFYAAMPDVLNPRVFPSNLHPHNYGGAMMDANVVPLYDTFTRATYDEVIQRVKEHYKSEEEFLEGGILPEHELDLTHRERVALFYGLKEYARYFPEEHQYANANYKGHIFPDCGEVSFLNVLNMFLYDFTDKRFRFDLLEGMGFVNEDLIQFYRDYDTIEKQKSRPAKLAWTNVVSGLGDLDADIRYKKGGKTCEISGGARSIAGVLRALFPDDTFRNIHTRGLSLLERVKETFDHLVELFSINGEEWSWEVKDAEEGDEQSINRNTGIAIQISKEGNNLPDIESDEGEEFDDPLFTWTFDQGHYTTSFPVGVNQGFLTPYVFHGLQRLIENPEVPLSASDLWLQGKYAYPGQDQLLSLSGLLAIAQVKDIDIFDEDESELKKLADQMTPQLTQQMLLRFLPTANVRNIMGTFLCFKLISELKCEPLHLFAANILESLPRNDPHAVLPFLELAIGEDGKLKASPPDIHRRIAAQLASRLKEVDDPEFAFRSLLLGMASEGVLKYLISKIPAGFLTKEQVAELFMELADDDDSTPEIWQLLLRKFGGVFRGADGKFDPSRLILYRTAEKEDSLLDTLLEESSEETIEWFLQSGLITKKDFLQNMRDAGEYPMPGVFREERYSVLVKIGQVLGVTMQDLQQVNRYFLRHLLLHHISSEKQETLDKLKKIFSAFRLTARDVIPEDRDSWGFCYFVADLLIPAKAHKIAALFDFVGLKGSKLEFLKDYTYSMGDNGRTVKKIRNLKNGNFHFPANITLPGDVQGAGLLNGTVYDVVRRLCPSLFDAEPIERDFRENFSPQQYMWTYRDLYNVYGHLKGEAQTEALTRHFLRHGKKEGRYTSLLPVNFSPCEYMWSYGDLTRAYAHLKGDKRERTLERHYLLHGRKEGRTGGHLPLTFSPQQYMWSYKDLYNVYGHLKGEAQTEALTRHFLRHGKKERRYTSLLPVNFSPREYMWSYPDLVRTYGRFPEQKQTAALKKHYLRHGKREGRAVTLLPRDFSSRQYMLSYPDLIDAYGHLSGEAQTQALTRHYLTRGRRERRVVTRLPEDFSPTHYMWSYPDRMRDFANLKGKEQTKALTQHYIRIGKAEGLVANLLPPNFSGAAYMWSYGDLTRAYAHLKGDKRERALERHYLLRGRKEGRSISRLPRNFSAARYMWRYPDLIKAYVHLTEDAREESLIRHYLTHGRSEGRSVTGH